MRAGRRRFLQNGSVLGAAALLRQVDPPPTPSPAAQPSPRPVVPLKAEDFGAYPGSRLNQSEALLRLRDRMAADREPHYRVSFRPGIYAYRNNRWLSDVGCVTLEALGCSFVNVSDDPLEANNRPFNAGSIFQDHDDRPFPQGISYRAGYLVRSAAAGARIVRLRHRADAGRIAAGARVLLHSFDQQWGGYPPNLRFFEWRRVVALDGTTGTIILDAPLRYHHDAALPDTPMDPPVGSARILPLERDGYHYPELIEIIGATFKRNPSRPLRESGGLVVAAETVILRDCRHEGALWPSENRLALYEDCRIASVEVDKLCDRAEFRRCRFDAPVVGATGVNELVLDRCEIHGHVAVSPRRARLFDNRIVVGGDSWGAIRSYYDAWPVELIDATDNSVEQGAGAVRWAINAGAADRPYRLVVDERGATNEILLDDEPDVRSRTIQHLAAGTCIQLRGTTIMGVITRLSYTSSRWCLAGDWPILIERGQLWEFCTIQVIREAGTRFVGRRVPVLRRLHPTQLRVGDG